MKKAFTNRLSAVESLRAECEKEITEVTSSLEKIEEKYKKLIEKETKELNDKKTALLKEKNIWDTFLKTIKPASELPADEVVIDEDNQEAAKEQVLVLEESVTEEVTDAKTIEVEETSSEPEQVSEPSKEEQDLAALWPDEPSVSEETSAEDSEEETTEDEDDTEWPDMPEEWN